MTREAPSLHVLYGITVGKSASTLLRGQLRWMGDQGWKVTLVTSPDDLAAKAANREGVPLRPVPMRREISLLKDVGSLVRWIRTIRSEMPDVVNVSTPKAGLVGGIAAWICRVPKRIYVVRGLRLEGETGVKAQLLRAAEWLTTRVATDVIFVSDSLATVAGSMGLVPRRSWIIGEGSSNGVDADAVARRASGAQRTPLRQRLGLDQDSFVAGYVGRLTSDKGIDTLIDAIGHPLLSSGVQFLLIGEAEDAQTRHRIERLGTSISRVGWTDDVWGHLPAIDVLVLPTLREGFPNVVLEAAAAGIPTITTRVTGAIDSVVDGETGLLVDSKDPDGLAKAINSLAMDRDGARHMGARARDWVRREFDPERIWSGLLAVMNGDYGASGLRSVGKRRERIVNP